MNGSKERIRPKANPAPPQPKPIRFITNDGGPYAKRRRISSACTTCRRRKTRCSGERPVCGTCRQSKNECGGYGSTDTEQTDYNTFKRGQSTEAKSLESPASTQKSTDGAPKPVSQAAPDQSYVGLIGSPPAAKIKEQHYTSDSRSDFYLTLSIRNRMPYFRYFGPTAIMPGFKQMVVKVSEKHSTTATSSAKAEPFDSPPSRLSGGSYDMPIHSGVEIPASFEVPLYDTSDIAPSALIVDLCETFFAHLGCSFPFLQKERFMRDLKEKQVDSILVDAVCALAARFSDDPWVTGRNSVSRVTKPVVSSVDCPPPERGQAFAQRAKASIIEAFPCPSVAVVQAALLLAYDEFGASRDSGLWMYLGIAIRMAQDLGMQKLEGLRYVGRNGPTPQTVRITREKEISKQTDLQSAQDQSSSIDNGEDVREQKAVERERVDTFWAVFCLDRYISSGTGRPVTLRDEDIEVSFPPLDEIDPETGWSLPWPALIRIVHLYGRVSDILNGIKEVAHVTPEVIDQLSIMESNLTVIYQGLSPRLHFNALNFHHYVSVGQGTNFIMLHFWFHTLIVLMHQPTLLHTFDGEIQQLFPKSRELSMSSAKTVADILAFSELISAKSALGNPFTSQPTYIVACAFLKETAIHTMSSIPPSRTSSPPSAQIMPAEDFSDTEEQGDTHTQLLANKKSETQMADQQLAARHTLLATAANQNYQRCYRALQQLETYWAGTKYILTVLDQKTKGVGDPLLYTREGMESALEVPRPKPSFTSPGWRRKLSWGAYLDARARGSPNQSRTERQYANNSLPPLLDPNQAIGWSLTGTMNSPRSANLAVLYPSEPQEAAAQSLDAITQQHFPLSPVRVSPQSSRHAILPAEQNRDTQYNFSSAVDPARISDADLLLNLHSPSNHAAASSRFSHDIPPPNNDTSTAFVYQPQQAPIIQDPQHKIANSTPYGTMMIESQDIDMTTFDQDDMMWLEYLSADISGLFDPGGESATATTPTG